MILFDIITSPQGEAFFIPQRDGGTERASLAGYHFLKMT